MNRLYVCRLLLGLVFPAFAAAAPAPATPSPEQVAAYGQRLLDEAIPADGPGIALLVARGDQVLLRAARGRASVELGVALTPEHRFRIGSVTKQFAAAGLLKLIEQGKAGLDDPLSRYVPGYPNGDAITLRELLNHTSGIRSYTDLPGYMADGVRRDLDTTALIGVFKDQKPDFAPGERWAYNNSGYVLVGAVIEAITGKPWYAWLDETLMQPLRLAHTRYGADDAVIDGYVEGYSLDAHGAVTRAAPLSMTQPHAAGALVSTLDDLWHWNQALHHGRVLGADSYRAMTTPEGAATTAHYGYGVQVGRFRGTATIEHGGGIFGFVSELVYLPEYGLTGVMLRNADGSPPPPILRRVMAYATGQPFPEVTAVPLAAGALNGVEGVYRLDAETTRVLRVVDGVLTSQRSGGAVSPLTPIGPDRFAFANSLARIELVRDRARRVTALRFYPDGDAAETWKLVSRELPDRAEIALSAQAKQVLVGEYTSPQLGFKVFVDADGALRIQVPGHPAFALKAQTPRRLFLDAIDARLEFEPAEGPARQVTLLQGSARIELRRAEP